MARAASGKRRVSGKPKSGRGVRRARTTETTDRIAFELTHARGKPKNALVTPVKAKIGKRTPSVGPKKGSGATKAKN